MWCKRVRNQMSAYADGELSAADRRAVEAHLAQCGACSGEFASLQTLVRLTSAIPLEETPTSLHTGIMTRLAGDGSTPRSRPRPAFPMQLSMVNPWMWAAASGAAAALIMGLFPAPSPSPTPDRVSKRSGSKPRAAEPSVRPETRSMAHSSPRPARPAPGAPGDASPEVEQAPDSTFLATAATEAAKANTVAPSSGAIARKPCVERLEKPQPVDPALPGKLAAEPRIAEPSSSASGSGKVTVPDEPDAEKPLKNEIPEIVPALMEKDGSTRMAGMSGPAEMPADEDEGVRGLRMFLEERNRTVPQPPLVQPRKL